MPKNIEDVIVPERRKSIRNIPIPEGRRKADPRYAKGSGEASKTTRDTLKKISSTPPISETEEYSPIPPQRHSIPHRSRSSRRRLWLAVLASAVILVFAVLSLFNRGTLAYVPRSLALTFDNELYTAKKTSDKGLIFSIVKLSGDKGAEVSASGEENVER